MRRLIVVALAVATLTIAAPANIAAAGDGCAGVSAEASSLFQVSDCHTDLEPASNPHPAGTAAHTPSFPTITHDQALIAACSLIGFNNPIGLPPQCIAAPTATVGPAQSMNALMLEAVRRVRPPAVEVVVQPPGGQTLVNLDTIFSAEAETFTRPVWLLGRRVLLRVTPSRFTWVHGDGSRQVTLKPGLEYRPGVSMDRYVSHRYLDAGRTVHPRVDVGYTARYSLNGGSSWRNVTGVVTIAGPASDLEVVEARPVLVGSG